MLKILVLGDEQAICSKFSNEIGFRDKKCRGENMSL